ncbi:MAG: hydrogenase formation protein HypD [Proteobacteria bacterium]|nr:hydrogenase formation protein HypD [Pseudomonadota bacterium]
MKHQGEFRNGAVARRLAERLRAVSTRPTRLMEICGTHTVALFRHGIRSILPENVTLISGPGCPVCVTATEEIDRTLRLARTAGVRVATFGDLIRVPGSDSSLKEEMAAGARVSAVYSTLDALQLARDHPDEEIVFIGIGFETTAPTVAAAVFSAARTGLPNFSMLSCHKLLPPAMEALLSSGDLGIDGFICPGHVTTVIGTAPYGRVAETHGTPCVVTGFEPVDLLQGILMLVESVEAGRADVAIQYKRGASPEGNPKAREIMNRVFEPADAPWRGLGLIPGSGLALRDEYRRFDARARFDLDVPPAKEPPGCRCGDVLRGAAAPPDCPLFRKACTPDRPVGPCMVSSEGACAAFHKYLGR